MKNKDRSSSCCNNHRRQSSKRFCNFYKHFGHSIETYYHRNKSTVSISDATVANTESVQPMALVFAQSQSSGSTLALVGFRFLLSLLMITLVIAGFLI